MSLTKVEVNHMLRQIAVLNLRATAGMKDSSGEKKHEYWLGNHNGLKSGIRVVERFVGTFRDSQQECFEDFLMFDMVQQIGHLRDQARIRMRASGKINPNGIRWCSQTGEFEGLDALYGITATSFQPNQPKFALTKKSCAEVHGRFAI